MLNYNDEMIRVAMSYIGIGSTVKNSLCDYYNKNCAQLVIDKSRLYNVKYTDNWCAMFMSVCAHKAGLTNFKHEVSVLQMRKIARLKGFYTNIFDTVKKGDMIVYNWNGDFVPDHIGLVVSKSLHHVVVVEGNYSSTVKIRVVRKDSNSIDGFIQL